MILVSQSSIDSLWLAIAFIVIATIITIITLLKYSFERTLQFWVVFGTIIGAMTTYSFTHEQVNKAEQRAVVAEKQSKDATVRLELAKADAIRTEGLLADVEKKASQAEERAAAAEKQSEDATDRLAVVEKQAKDATDRLAVAKADAKRTEGLLADAEKKAGQAEQRAAVAENQSKDATERLELAEVNAKRIEALRADAEKKAGQAAQRAAVAEKQAKDATERLALAKGDAKRAEPLRADAGTTPKSSTISRPRPSDRKGALVSIRQEPTVQSSPYGISYEEFRVHARNQDAVIVDGRDPSAYSQGHVPGAINIPGGERPPYRDRYLKNADPDQLILIYCNSASCHISDMLAERFQAEGFTNVRVYAPGWQVLSARMRDLR